ncbi:MAG: sodium:proton antiporter [Polyangiaceae bacterium]
MPHALENPPLVVALAMFAGVFAQVVARHTNVPGIVLLLIVGVLLGPDGAGVIRPEALGRGLEGVVGFAVAVILFEGGLNLDWRVLRRQQKPIQRLVLLGSVLTAGGAALFAHAFMGWEWRRAFLFGTLVIVTGPTVITPLLRRIHARHSIDTILEAEGIFIDAVGATIAVVALEVLLAPPEQRLGRAALGILMRFGVGTLVGIAGGGLFSLLMRFRSALPEGLANVAALASAVALFEISNAITPESGITAAILAGMVVGHTRSHDLEELRGFKEQLTVLLVATLFVLLAADVRLSEIHALGWRGVGTVLALIFVVRPVNVFASTFRTELELREKLFLSWLAPRGIGAAAVSSLFAQRMTDAGIEGGEAMRALVFLVIAMTVLVQGMSAGLVASLLRVRLPRNVGFAILGANDMARNLGAALAAATREEIVFIETNPEAARLAEEAGFKVVFGDGLDERSLIKARVQTRRACIAATPNESVNFLFARKLRARAKNVPTYVAIERKEAGISELMVSSERARVLFAGAQELSQWATTRRKSLLEVYLAEASSSTETAFDGLPPGSALPLTLQQGERVEPIERSYRAKAGDLVCFAVAQDEALEAHLWLTKNGWLKRESERPAEAA